MNFELVILVPVRCYPIHIATNLPSSLAAEGCTIHWYKCMNEANSYYFVPVMDVDCSHWMLF